MSHSSAIDSETEAEVLEEMVAQLGAALDPYYGQSDPSAYAARFADRVTTFDASSPVKFEDDDAVEHLMGFKGQIPPLDYKILNPAVQVFDDTAVFTFQVDLADPAAGKRFAVWSATEVHHRANDAWNWCTPTGRLQFLRHRRPRRSLAIGGVPD